MARSDAAAHGGCIVLCFEAPLESCLVVSRVRRWRMTLPARSILRPRGICRRRLVTASVTPMGSPGEWWGPRHESESVAY